MVRGYEGRKGRWFLTLTFWAAIKRLNENFSSFHRGQWLKIEMYGAVGSQVLDNATMRGDIPDFFKHCLSTLPDYILLSSLTALVSFFFAPILG